MPGELDDLLDHLERATRLSRAEAARVVEEVLEFLSEPVPDFVARRHSELRAAQLCNDEIFERIARELERWRFRAPALSRRQIRRLIYG